MNTSCSRLASDCGCEERNVRKAIKELTRRCLISTMRGTPTRRSWIGFSFLRTVSTGGVKTTPLTAAGGVDSTPLPPGRFDPTEPVKSTPPRAEQKALFQTAPDLQSIDVDPTVLEVIDRSQKTRPQAEIEECRQLMHAWRVHTCRAAGAPAPDQRATWWMLSAADWPKLKGWLEAVLRNGWFEAPANVTNPYAWFATVALQRLSNIEPARSRPILRAIKGGRPPETPGAETTPDPTAEAEAPPDVDQLRAAIAAAAAGKQLR